MDYTRFQSLLHALASGDNATRAKAEKAYEGFLGQDSNKAIQYLTMATTQEGEHKALGAILLRRLVGRVGAWANVPATGQRAVLQKLFQAFEQEKVASVQHKVAHVIAQLVAVQKQNQDGLVNHALKAISACAKTGETSRFEAALFLLDKMLEHADAAMDKHAQKVQAFIKRCFTVPNPSVQVAAVQAATSFVASMHVVENRPRAAQAEFDKFCSEFIGYILKTVLASLVKAGRDADVNTVLKSLCTIAMHIPARFAGQLDQASKVVMGLARSKDAETSTRALCVEVMNTLCEAENGGVVRKNAPFVNGVLSNLVAMMTNVNTDDWKAAVYEDHPDEDQDSPWIVGREALARVADAIGGNTVMSPGFVKHLTTLMVSEAWQKRWAALEAVSMLACSSSCASIMKKKTGMVDQVLRYLKDGHQRVRQVALECIARFANAFPGDYQDKYGTMLLPQISRMAAGADAPAPSLMMVRGTAMAVLVDFCNPEDEVCSHETLIPHLKTVLQSIGRLLTAAKAHEVVQQKCLLALARVAAIAEEDFGQYYSFFSKGLEQVLRNARSDAHGELRAEAIRCVGMIAAAVGPEQFTGKDAAKFIGLIQAGARSADILNDPQLRPILRAVVAICTSIEDKMVRDRAVKFVLPLAQKVLSTEIELKYKQVEEGEKVDVDTAHGMSGTTLQIRGLGNVNLQLNTELIDDKVAACEAFGELAENLPQYINKAVVSAFAPLLVSHIDFKFLSAVRTGSALAVAKLFGAVAKAVAKNPSPGGSDMLQNLFKRSIPPMMKRLEKEDADGAGWMALAIKHAVQVCADNKAVAKCPMKFIQSIMTLLFKNIKSGARRQIEAIQANKRTRYHDAEERAADLEEALTLENELMTELIDSLGYLIKWQGAPFVKYFFSLEGKAALKFFVKMMTQKESDDLQRFALCVFVDSIEFGQLSGALRTTVLNAVVPRLVEGLKGAPDKRQVCAYGVGQMAVHLKEYLQAKQPLLQRILQQLMALVNHPDCRSQDNENSTDNAVSALGKLIPLWQHPDQAQKQKLWQSWLSYLPLRKDKIEAKAVHKQLCAQTDALVKMDGAKTHLIRIMVQVMVHKKLADEESRKLMQSRLKVAVKSAPERRQVQEMAQKLSASQQKTLSVVLA